MRKALSGVARMSSADGEGWQPKFGRGRIVQTLVGSRSREIIDARLDQLSTYGLLKNEGVAYLNQLIRELQDAGMLISNGGQYPMVTLTSRGEAIMKGSHDYALRWPQRVTRSAKKSEQNKEGADTKDLAPFDRSLFEKLKKVRLTLARENGNLPAYSIFPDETLRAFCSTQTAFSRSRPTNPRRRRSESEEIFAAFLEAIGKHETI